VRAPSGTNQINCNKSFSSFLSKKCDSRSLHQINWEFLFMSLALFAPFPRKPLRQT
jgi:hypothetical protein